jgi:hypothetical protein
MGRAGRERETLRDEGLRCMTGGYHVTGASATAVDGKEDWVGREVPIPGGRKRRLGGITPNARRSVGRSVGVGRAVVGSRSVFGRPVPVRGNRRHRATPSTSLEDDINGDGGGQGAASTCV